MTPRIIILKYGITYRSWYFSTLDVPNQTTRHPQTFCFIDFHQNNLPASIMFSIFPNLNYIIKKIYKADHVPHTSTSSEKHKIVVGNFPSRIALTIESLMLHVKHLRMFGLSVHGSMNGCLYIHIIYFEIKQCHNCKTIYDHAHINIRIRF